MSKPKSIVVEYTDLPPYILVKKPLSDGTHWEVCVF